MPKFIRKTFTEGGGVESLQKKFEEGTPLYLGADAVEPIEEYQGYSFLDFLSLYKKILAQSKNISGTPENKSFDKVVFESYLSRFCIMGTAGFSYIKNTIEGISNDSTQTTGLSGNQPQDASAYKELLSALRTKAGDYILQMEANQKLNTFSVLLKCLKELLQMIQQAQGVSNDPLIGTMENNMVTVVQMFDKYVTQHVEPKIMVNDYNYKKHLTKGREEWVARGTSGFTNMVSYKSAMQTLVYLKERISNDFIFPLSNLQAEIKTLAKYKKYYTIYQNMLLTPDRFTPEQMDKAKAKVGEFESIVQDYGISVKELVIRSYQNFVAFSKIAGYSGTKEEYLLLNRFTENRKGDFETSPVSIAIMVPVIVDGDTELIRMTELSFAAETGPAGNKFELEFLQELKTQLGKKPTNLVIRDVAGFKTEMRGVSADTVQLTFRDVGDPQDPHRKNAHADIVIRDTKGNEVGHFSLKKEEYQHLGGTNLERLSAGDRETHSERTYEQYGIKWDEDVNQFNQLVGKLMAASDENLLRITEKERQTVITRLNSAMVGQVRAPLVQQMIEHPLYMSKRIKDLISSTDPAIVEIVRGIKNNIEALKTKQGLDIQVSFGQLESKFIEQKDLKFWRMIFEQSFAARMLFGEEREGIKSEIGFENVSHIIVGVPTFIQMDGAVGMIPSGGNQFIVTNKGFKSIQIIKPKEIKKEGDSAIVKYSSFLKRNLPILFARKHARQKFLNVKDLGITVSPVSVLVPDKVLDSPEVTAVFNEMINAGKLKDRKKYIMQLHNLSDRLNQSLQAGGFNYIRLENDSDLATVVQKVNSNVRLSYSINLAVSIVLFDRKVKIADVITNFYNNPATGLQAAGASTTPQSIQEALISLVGVLDKNYYDLLENVVLPQQQASPANVMQEIFNNVNRQEVQKILFAMGVAVGQRELVELQRSNVSSNFQYDVKVVLDF
jgi:hypothetical protein